MIMDGRGMIMEIIARKSSETERVLSHLAAREPRETDVAVACVKHQATVTQPAGLRGGLDLPLFERPTRHFLGLYLAFPTFGAHKAPMGSLFHRPGLPGMAPHFRYPGPVLSPYFFLSWGN